MNAKLKDRRLIQIFEQLDQKHAFFKRILYFFMGSERIFGSRNLSRCRSASVGLENQHYEKVDKLFLSSYHDLYLSEFWV
jgi:hypothetical protein